MRLAQCHGDQARFEPGTPWSVFPDANHYASPPSILWEGGCINGPGHMTKMAITPIYGKTLKNLHNQIKSPLNLKLGMQHQGLKLYKVYINDHPGLTLAYFTVRPIGSLIRLDEEN